MVVRTVNYFGHAAVVATSASGVVLGAMVPDFSTMSGARIAGTSDPDVATGIALHHATDAAFHALPTVIALMRELDARLERLGCARGPRRAVAHIGVELLLDGALVDDPAYRDGYLRGLAHDAAITWRDAGDGERFATLLARLRGYGVPQDLRRPEAIVYRLSRALGHRPLLAPSANDLVAIATAIADHQPKVVASAMDVMASIQP